MLSSNPFFRRTVPAACVLLLTAIADRAAQPAKPAPAAKSKPAAASTNAAPVVLEPPQSVFYVPTSMEDAAKDPFFPKSTRLRKVVPVASNTSAPPPPVPVKLELKGISGTANQRLAIINTYTFGVGEEAELSSGNDKTRLKVLEINTDSVVIQVRGEKQVLKLRSGI